MVLKTFRHFLEALHVPLGAFDIVLFQHIAHDLHHEGFEFEFCFDDPERLTFALFDEFVFDEVVGEIVFVDADEFIGLVAVGDFLGQGEFAFTFFIGQCRDRARLTRCSVHDLVAYQRWLPLLHVLNIIEGMPYVRAGFVDDGLEPEFHS
jgi:hypothetical protein